MHRQRKCRLKTVHLPALSFPDWEYLARMTKKELNFDIVLSMYGSRVSFLPNDRRIVLAYIAFNC